VLPKDKFGCVGLEVSEGPTGALLVQNILRGGVDTAEGSLEVGDELLAVDGVCVVGRGYSTALAAIRAAGPQVHFLLATHLPSHAYLRQIRYNTAPETDNCLLASNPIDRHPASSSIR